MSVFIRSTLLACVVLFSSLSFAQQNIAVIYMQTAMINTDYAKSKIKALEASEGFSSRVGKLKSISEELKKMEADREKNSLTWNDEQKKSFEQRARERLEERNLVRSQLDAQRKNILRDIEVHLTPQIEKIVPALVEEKKIDLLLNNQAVFVVADKYNLTEELIKRLNKAGK